jgi:hypothetical protein
MQIYGNIESIRNVEDCIRATKRYVIKMKKGNHPIQGDEPTSNFTIDYTVYLTSDESKLMNSNVSLIGEYVKLYNWFISPSVDVHFTYDYRVNSAEIRCKKEDIEKLKDVIPSFNLMITNIKECEKNVEVKVQGN